MQGKSGRLYFPCEVSSPQWAGITRQMYMNLPKTHNNDRAHENHANTLSCFGIDFFHIKKNRGGGELWTWIFFCLSWKFCMLFLWYHWKIYIFIPPSLNFFWNSLILKTVLVETLPYRRKITYHQLLIGFFQTDFNAGCWA